MTTHGAVSRRRAKQRNRSLIQIFDMVWWSHFRNLEPVEPAPKM
jgi:hypothetical protein